MQVSSNYQSFTQYQTRSTRGESLQPSTPQDQVTISGDQRAHGDYDEVGKVFSGMFFGAGGAIGGAIAGAAIGKYAAGLPILGTVGGIAIGGIAGFAYGYSHS